jgi:hypothetical protein
MFFRGGSVIFILFILIYSPFLEEVCLLFYDVAGCTLLREESVKKMPSTAIYTCHIYHRRGQLIPFSNPAVSGILRSACFRWFFCLQA